MLPEQPSILQSSASTEDYALSELRTRAGYHPQYARNTLQLNRGDGRFSDIGLLAGVHATDWSWAPLLADLDDDGRKDLFVTSGIYRRPNDLDYIDFVGQPSVQAALSDSDHRGESRAAASHAAAAGAQSRVPQCRRPAIHRMRRERGGSAQPRLLERRRVRGPRQSRHPRPRRQRRSARRPAIYRNRGAQPDGKRIAHGDAPWRGAELGGDRRQAVRSHRRTHCSSSSSRRRAAFSRPWIRGCMSGSDAPRVADSVIVVWPDRRFQVLTQVPANRSLVALAAGCERSVDAARHPRRRCSARCPPSAASICRTSRTRFVDFEREPLMPRLLSTEGPALATADVDGDGLDDLFLGGSERQAGRLLVQRRDGTFQLSEQPSIAADSIAEDVDAVFFDANGDRSPDLYVVSAGNQFWDTGRTHARPPLPQRRPRALHARRRVRSRSCSTTERCVAAGDFDGDGHVDLFLGSRSVPSRYGASPKSHLLRNDGRGRFTRRHRGARAGAVRRGDDHLRRLARLRRRSPARSRRRRRVDAGARVPPGAGEARRTDDAGGARRERGVVELRHRRRRERGLAARTSCSATSGSTRTSLRRAPHRHASISATSRTTESSRPSSRSRATAAIIRWPDVTSSRAPSRRSAVDFRPTRHSAGARSTASFPKADLRAARTLVANTFASAIARNDGRGQFVLQPLPVEAQLAPVYAVVAEDFDRDGRTDLLLGGNFNGVPPIQGRYDASYGLLLRGGPDGRFAADGHGAERRRAHRAGAPHADAPHGDWPPRGGRPQCRSTAAPAGRAARHAAAVSPMTRTPSHPQSPVGVDMTMSPAHARRHPVGQAAATLVAALAIGCQTAPRTEIAAPVYGPPTSPRVYDPSRDLGPLFHDVQMARVFPDSKTFVDARPARSRPRSWRATRRERDPPGFDLARVRRSSISMPRVPPRRGLRSDTAQSMEAHIRALWPSLTRAPTGGCALVAHPAAEPVRRPGRTFSRGLLLGLVLHDARPRRERPRRSREADARQLRAISSAPWATSRTATARIT